MSEIKGQLLGMLMVLVVFSMVGMVLYSNFKAASEKIAEKMNEESVLISKMS